MNRIFPRFGLAVALSLPLFAAGLPIASADSAQQATVNITNTGFSPVVVNVPLNGSVTFVNQDVNVHTATSGSAPLPFNTGGIETTKSASVGFGVPGTYNYSDAATCLNNQQANDPNFNCSTTYQVIVGTAQAASSAPPAAAPAAASAPAPIASVAPVSAPATAGVVQQNATVTITDTGISPASVTVTAGGSVTFINQGSKVHTATSSGGGNPLPFDSGGLGAGQTANVGFGTAGTYTYTSSTDCLNGNSAPGFNCGLYTINVTNAAAAAAAAAPAPAAAAPAPAVPAASAPAATVSQPTGGANVTITDSGYTPSTLTVAAGSTVTWVNKGNNVHSVTSVPGYIPTFDSGGLGPNQSYSFQFTKSGSYAYRSTTDTTYSTDPTTGSTITNYQLNGTIVVQ